MGNSILNAEGIPMYGEFDIKTCIVMYPDRKVEMYGGTYQFGVDEEEDKEFQPYMDEFDVVIIWTCKESDVHLIPEKFEIFKKITPNTRRMVGCYLYNFGEEKQATGEAVKWQLDWYREKILTDEAEGVVLHTNTTADLDYEAYDGMELHGDEVIPD